MIDRPASRSPSASLVETTQLVLPPDTNNHGTTFGGKIMQWMDIAASISAGRHCRGPVVTAAVDELHFSRPIRLGDVVIIRAQVNHASRTSMEVGVQVEREDARTRKLEPCLAGYFTFVGLDEAGNPKPVPPIEPETEAEKKSFAEAAQRRARRLASRNQSAG